MFRVHQDYAFGTFDGNTIALQHNRGNWPDIIYVFDRLGRPIKADKFDVVNETIDHFTLTFKNGAVFRGRYEVLFTHPTIVQSGVGYELYMDNAGVLQTKVVTPPAPPPPPPDPPNGQ